jgi:hypothetical protein
VAFTAIVCGLALPVSRVSAQEDAEMRRIFDLILQDPANPAHNMRYAALAIERGELRKAMAAYERILARDPNNEEARAGLRRVRLRLEPAITRANVLLGAQYESNARRTTRQGSNTHDATLFARGDVTDDRVIAGTRWRSAADVYGNYHPRFHDIDYGYVSARSGPVIDLRDDLHVHFFAGGGYSWLTRRTFYGEATAGMNVEFDIFSPLRDLTVRWGYDFVGRTFSSRDATFVEVSSRFQFPDLMMKKAIGIVVPYWRYSGVFGSGSPAFDSRSEPFPARSHQFGARADYFFPVFEWLTVDANFTYEYRYYFETVTDKSKNRRDQLFVPGVQAIVPGLIDGRADILIHYAYEYRSTNDGPQRYQNHIGGLRLLWRF